MAERSARVNVTADDVLRELKRLATVDIMGAFTPEGGLKALKEMDPDVRRCISSIDVEELWDGDKESGRFKCGNVHKLKFHDKLRALELLGKHLKLFTEKVEHSGNLTLEELVLAANKREGQ